MDEKRDESQDPSEEEIQDLELDPESDEGREVTERVRGGRRAIS